MPAPLPTAPTPAAPKVFVTGYYGFGNAGDEAILETLLRHLRERRPDLAIAVTSATPEATASAYGVEAVPWSDSAAILAAVCSASLILIGGGGIFHDYWGFDPHTLLTDDHWGISFYTGPAVLGALNGKPVMLYAIGAGPLLSQHARQFTKIACDAAQVITVRDAASQKLLEELGVTAVTLTADPVFDYAVTPTDPPAEARLGVALRAWNVGVHPDYWEREAALALDQFLDTHPIQVTFLPFQRLESSLEDDAAVAHRVRGRMRHQDRARVLESQLPPSGIAREIAACDLVLAMRLHASILAAAARVPVVSLSYDTKVDQSMERVGLDNLTLDVRSFDASALAAKLSDAYTRRAELRAHLGRDVPLLAAEARRNADLAIELLESGMKPILSPEIAALAGEKLQCHMVSLSELRRENQRLFKEFEYYRGHNQELSARVSTLESDSHQLADDLVQARRSLEARDASVARLRNEAKSVREKLEEAAKNQKIIEKKLRAAEDIRARTLRGLDQFQKALDSNLAS